VRRNAKNKLTTLASNTNMGQEVFNYCRMGTVIGFGIFEVHSRSSNICINILLLQSVVEVYNAHKHNRDINYYDFLEEIKKIIRYRYEYFVSLIQFGGSLFSIIKVTSFQEQQMKIYL